MLFRMIRGVLLHQKSKMLLIALTIALGASLATGMLNVVLGVEEKVNKELKNYGANITVKPKDLRVSLAFSLVTSTRSTVSSKYSLSFAAATRAARAGIFRV